MFTLTSVGTPALSLRRNRRLATRGRNSLPVKNSPPFDSLPPDPQADRSLSLRPPASTDIGLRSRSSGL